MTVREGLDDDSRTVAAAVGAALSEAGIDHVFGLVGSGNFALTNALVGSGARFISARHEGAAICGADAFTRLTGRPSAVSVHQGPGFTNLLTGLAEAAKSRTPIIVLAADTPRGAIRSNFRIDEAALAAGVGALSDSLYSPESAVSDALRAYHRAQAERRPLVLQMPIDVQSAPAPTSPPVGLQARLHPPRPSMTALREAAELLLHARRPLVIAGRGAVIARARRPIEDLAERLGALLATSAAAHGLFAGSPWSLGISGGFAAPAAARLIQQADVVIALGATLNMWTTRRGRLLAADAAIIQVDLDADAIGLHQPVRIGIVGDAAEAASCLSAELDTVTRRFEGWRTAEVAEQLRTGGWRDVRYRDQGGHGRIDPRTLSIRLDELLPEERVIAVDSGHFMGWPAMYMRVPDAAGFVFTQAFQAVGLGLGSAIGAAIARPDRLVVAALGDGGALMGLSELETVVRLGVRMLTVVYNDAAYGAEVHHFGPDGANVDLVRFPDTDLAALARGAGWEAATIREPADLKIVSDWLRAGGGKPLLLDAKVVPDVVGEWLQEAFGH